MLNRMQMTALATAGVILAATVIGTQWLDREKAAPSGEPTRSEETSDASGTRASIDAGGMKRPSVDAGVDTSDLSVAEAAPVSGSPTSSDGASRSELAEPLSTSPTAVADENAPVDFAEGPKTIAPEPSRETASIASAELDPGATASFKGESQVERARRPVDTATPTPVAEPGAPSDLAIETVEASTDPGQAARDSTSTTAQEPSVVKRQPTLGDDLAALEDDPADLPNAGEPVVAPVANLGTMGLAENEIVVEGALTTPVLQTPDFAISTGNTPEDAAQPGAEAEVDSPKPAEPSAEVATTDEPPVATRSAETAESSIGAASLWAPGEATVSAPPSAVEPAAGPALTAVELPIDVSLVHFNHGSSYLSPGGAMMVDRAAAALVELDGEFLVEVVGFTDTVGTVEFNIWLAERRVNRVIDALVERGIPRDNLIGSPRGPFDLPVPTGDNVSEPLNRCVAVTLIDAQ